MIIQRDWIDDKKEDSVEDREFRSKIYNSIEFVDGHYSLPLPFRDDVLLPDNKCLAAQRLNSIGKKFQKNPDFRSDFTKFMTTLSTNVCNSDG